MPQKRVRLVVGLGNPGSAYEMTRHNTGFMVVDKVAATFAISIEKRKFNTHFGQGFVENIEVILAKPMAYMNNCGPPVKKLADYFKISREDMLVIHDDIDLDLGRLKIKEKGGHGGHKGIKSLMTVFGGGDFVRLRIGVGRPETAASVTDHVLGCYSEEETRLLDPILTRAQDAVVATLSMGVKDGMNRFNDKKFHMTR
jgi:PTH1 family peptidyl-tRNA hydrolase